LSRKGICANHVKDVGAFFRGAHVTIHARNEEEVEPAVILDKVAKASSTKLDFKDRSDIVENTGPVGTNYQRVQAAKEINSSERESFWTKQQEEERRRKIEERKRSEEERKKIEEVEKKRELLEAKEREISSSKKDQEISKRREMEKNAENRARDLMDVRRLSNVEDDLGEDPEEERTRRSEEARKQRALEARTLIDKSKIKDVRAMFEQQSSAPVVPVKKPGLVAKAINRFNGTTVVVKKPQESSSFAARKDAFEPSKKPEPITQVNHVQNAKKLFEQQSEHVDPVKIQPRPKATNGKTNGSVKSPSEAAVTPPSTQHAIPSMKPDVIPIVEQVVKSPSPAATASNQDTNSEPDEEPIASPVEDPVEEDSDSDYIVHDEEVEQPPRRLSAYDLPVGEHMLEDIAEEPEEDDHTEHGSSHGKVTHQKRARALYDYQAADETEISFDPEEIITHVDMIDPGWYQGMAPDGSYGLFPANYVEILED
jgi:hypothetical protein